MIQHDKLSPSASISTKKLQHDLSENKTFPVPELISHLLFGDLNWTNFVQNKFRFYWRNSQIRIQICSFCRAFVIYYEFAVSCDTNKFIRNILNIKKKKLASKS